MYQRGIINILLIVIGLVIACILIGVFSGSSSRQTETTTTTTYYGN